MVKESANMFGIALIPIAIGIIYGIVQFISDKAPTVQSGRNYVWFSVGIFLTFFIYNIIMMKKKYPVDYDFRCSKKDWYLILTIVFMPFITAAFYLLHTIAGWLLGSWSAGGGGGFEVTIQCFISIIVGLIFGAKASTILYLSTYFSTATTGLSIAVITHNFLNNGGVDIFALYDFFVEIYLDFIPEQLTGVASSALAALSILMPFLLSQKIENN